MAFDARANLAVSTVATAPTPASSGTSLVMATGHGSRCPAVPFDLAVTASGASIPDPSNTELVRVTDRTSDTLTVTRAQHGTTARSIGVGDTLAVVVTARAFAEVETGTLRPVHAPMSGVNLFDAAEGCHPNRGSGTGGDFGNANLGTTGGQTSTSYNYPTLGDLKYLASRGQQFVRVLFRWERMQPVLNSGLDATEATTRMIGFLDNCSTAGIQAIICPDHGGAYWIGGPAATRYYIGTAQVPVSAYLDFMTRLVGWFGYHPALYAIDLGNEPTALTTGTTRPGSGASAEPARWEYIADAAVRAMREAGWSKLISVPTYAATGDNPYSQHPDGPWIADPLIIWQWHLYLDTNSGGGGQYLVSYATEVTNNAANGVPAGRFPDTLSAERAGQITNFIRWLGNRRGWLGEIGWPQATDTEQWGALGSACIRRARSAGIMVSFWMASRQRAVTDPYLAYGRTAAWPADMDTVTASGLQWEAAALDEAEPLVIPASLRGAFAPADVGLLACNFDPACGVTTSTPLNSSGVLYLQRIRLDEPTKITNIVVSVTTAGATLTAGQNFAALYDSTGALVAGSQTADQSTPWVSTGVKTMAMAGGAKTLNTGYYWVALWANGTTRPAFFRGVSSAVVNGVLAAASSRFATSNNAVTTTAPATLGTKTAATTAYWVGLS